MKVHLAYRDRDLDLEAEPPPNADELVQDLGLDIILDAMAHGDRYLRQVARAALFASLHDPAAIRYRQAVIDDALAHPEVVRELYDLTVTALHKERQFWIYSARLPESVLSRSIALLGHVLVQLRRMRDVAREHGASFASEGFGRLFRELSDELDDAYLQTVQAHLERLRFGRGVLVSATLGAASEPTSYVLRRRTSRRGLRERIGLGEADSCTWQLDPRDIAGAEALSALRQRGVALAAAALGESTDHILDYLGQLQAELGLCLGALNLHHALTTRGAPVCMPEPAPSGGAPVLAAQGLYDGALSLALAERRAIGNDLAADGRSLIVVTGANRGGKSTFLRSLGIAQLLMQAGLFVPASSFRADLRTGLFTHFRREEDRALRSGKLDEELIRMDAIVERVGRNGMLLLNESFASTNEREGSEIGRQIVAAMVESGIKVVYVTHMFELASRLRAESPGGALFLRAERLPDGRRTFRVLEGEPLPTSHGQDIYQRIFEPASSAEVGEGPASEPDEGRRGVGHGRRIGGVDPGVDQDLAHQR
jgi:hypothetical protein